MTNEERIKDAFLDMLNQSCGKWEVPKYDHEKREYIGDYKFKGYDSLCISAYETALDLAVELGWIKKEEFVR